MYQCPSCHYVITMGWFDRYGQGDLADMCFPEAEQVDRDLPERAREYLRQAMESPPAPAVMAAASSVDSMLKAKGLKDGSLCARIEQAAKDHLITEGMKEWAHQVRLDANDQRHSDDNAPLPTADEAKRAVEFAKALGKFLFTLPAMVQRGLQPTKASKPN